MGMIFSVEVITRPTEGSVLVIVLNRVTLKDHSKPLTSCPFHGS